MVEALVHDSVAKTSKVPETVGVRVPLVLSVTLELLRVVQPIPVNWEYDPAAVVPTVAVLPVICKTP